MLLEEVVLASYHIRCACRTRQNCEENGNGKIAWEWK